MACSVARECVLDRRSQSNFPLANRQTQPCTGLRIHVCYLLYNGESSGTRKTIQAQSTDRTNTASVEVRDSGRARRVFDGFCSAIRTVPPGTHPIHCGFELGGP